MSKPSNKGVVPLALRMRVRKLLDSENVTQSNLARFCDVTASTMSHWIRDTGVLSVQMVAETSGKFERLLDQVKPGTLADIIDAALAKLPSTAKDSRKSSGGGGSGGGGSKSSKSAKSRKRGRPAEPRERASARARGGVGPIEPNPMFLPPQPATPEQEAAAALAAGIPYTFGVPQSALADAGYTIDTDGSRWDARSAQAWHNGYRVIRAIEAHRFRAGTLELRVRWQLENPLGGEVDAAPATQGKGGRRSVRGGEGGSSDDDDDDDDDSVFDVPVGTVHPRFATVTPRGMAAAKAAAASARAAGGGKWSNAGSQSALGSAAQAAASSTSTPAGSVTEPMESSASFEFAFILRDMRRPLCGRPVTASLPVSKSELAWTYENTGCLQVPGHGIEDSDSDDVRERDEVVKRLARTMQQ
ncbi:hypothetical protein FNF27_04893 [Cafeteria roenbergensis]|uniref:HTH cro/C1-type domain-containing protein n=1 Tax=Cafeteria roenbergensis TaxID=33653 RepID=A0A5A8EA41_CAFRO|nr:hypothetical protein FNF27_04893 [Cafeteria roenbergensis]